MFKELRQELARIDHELADSDHARLPCPKTTRGGKDSVSEGDLVRVPANTRLTQDKVSYTVDRYQYTSKLTMGTSLSMKVTRQLRFILMKSTRPSSLIVYNLLEVNMLVELIQLRQRNNTYSLYVYNPQQIETVRGSQDEATSTRRQIESGLNQTLQASQDT